MSATTRQTMESEEESDMEEQMSPGSDTENLLGRGDQGRHRGRGEHRSRLWDVSVHAVQVLEGSEPIPKQTGNLKKTATELHVGRDSQRARPAPQLLTKQTHKVPLMMRKTLLMITGLHRTHPEKGKDQRMRRRTMRTTRARGTPRLFQRMQRMQREWILTRGTPP